MNACWVDPREPLLGINSYLALCKEPGTGDLQTPNSKPEAWGHVESSNLFFGMRGVKGRISSHLPGALSPLSNYPDPVSQKAPQRARHNTCRRTGQVKCGASLQPATPFARQVGPNIPSNLFQPLPWLAFSQERSSWPDCLPPPSRKRRRSKHPPSNK